MLQRDIVRQDMMPGDKFFSVREIASQYGVSLATAHQGVKLLADRQYVEIRSRSGTIIGTAASDSGAPSTRVSVIHLIVGRVQMDANSLMRLVACSAILESWPGASVQVTMLPEKDSLAFLDRLIGKGEGRPETVGAILVCCSREVKEYFMASGLPTVVNGHVEEHIELPYVDRDQRAVGHAAASHLLDRGHRRIGLLMYNEWRPGDTLLVAGIQRAMGERQLAADDLTIGSVPGEPELVRKAVHHMVAAPDRVTAVITRADGMAVECVAVAKQLGLRMPEDLAIISTGEGGPVLTEADPPITGWANNANEIGRLLGQTLASVSCGESASRLHFECPTRLVQRKTT